MFEVVGMEREMEMEMEMEMDGRAGSRLY